MKPPAILTLGLAVLTAGNVPAPAAAPVPAPARPPAVEGKYTLAASAVVRAVPGGFGGGGRGGGPAAAAPLRTARLLPPNRQEATVTRDTITIAGTDTTWEYRIDPSAKPMAIDLTIVPLIGKKVKVAGIIEATGDRLVIAHAEEGAERPKSFDPADGVSVYVFQKAPPPPRTEYRIVVLRVGKEAEAEAAINRLARDGFEVAHTTTPTSPPESVIHFVLKRTVRDGDGK